MRLGRRTLAAGIGAALVITVPSDSLAQKAGYSDDDRSKPPKILSMTNTEAYPITFPGNRARIHEEIANLSKKPGKVWLQFYVNCEKRNGDETEHRARKFRVRVPGNPDAPGSLFPAKVLNRKIKTPTNCARKTGMTQDGYFNVDYYRKKKSKNDYASGLYQFFKVGWKFTRRNARSNLNLKTPKKPKVRKKYEAHHTLPVKFEPWFSGKGRRLNIHHPEYLRWWCKPSHRKHASGYNRRWNNFIETNHNAGRKRTLKFRKAVSRKYKGEYRCGNDAP